MISRLLFFVSLFLLCSSFLFGQFSPIRLNMVIHDPSGVPHTIIWGLDPAATSGLDRSLGEIELPPLPPANFDARWTNPPGMSALGNGVAIDIRNFSSTVQVDTYKVHFQPGNLGYPVTLQWSRTLVHDYYGCAATLVGPPNSIQDQHGVLQQSVDMRANDSVRVIDPDISSLLLITRCPLGSNSISGRLFHDLDGDGLQQAGEPGLQGWSVALSGDKTDEATSDTSGNFNFPNLPNGTYTVNEILPSGWIGTSPAGGNFTFTLSDGRVESGAVFGNFQAGSLGGRKFSDLDGDGLENNADTAIAGWKIYLEGAKTDSALTDAGGNYVFSNLGPGTYTLRERQDSDWVQMKPGAPGFYSVALRSGAHPDTFAFGNKRANRYTGASGGNWSDPANWSFGHPPGATEVAVISADIVFDAASSTTVEAIRVTGGATIQVNTEQTLTVLTSMQVEVGSTLTFESGPAASRSGRVSAAVQPGMVCYGDWNVKGTFLPGRSKITFAGNATKTILRSSFYDLEIAGNNTTTEGNLSVGNQLSLLNDFSLGSGDSLIITNPATDAIVNSGKILSGTLRRSIGAGETGAYRFADPQTFVQFSGIGNPGWLAMTPSGTAFPASPNLKWHLVPGSVNTSNHTITAAGITHFSAWTVGTPDGDVIKLSGIPQVGGMTLINSGGGGAVLSATMQFSYDPSSITPGTSEDSLALITGPYYTDSVQGSWNMVSLPVTPENDSTSALFPSTISGAFSYDGGGYVPAPSLLNGRGYWMKFGSPTPVSILGSVILTDTIPLTPGWNLIGSASYETPRSALTTDPPNILRGNFFGYDHAYQIATSLRPMRAYWVKSSAAGNLIFTSSPLLKSALSAGRSPLDAFNTLTIVDASGSEQTLYFAGHAPRGEEETQFFEAPPLPPPGIFDARFASDRIAEAPDPGAAKAVALRLSDAAYPLTIRWHVKDPSTRASLDITGTEARLGTGSGESEGQLSVSELQAGRIRLVFSPAAAAPANLPSEFRLEQNYPNPFNPSTVIEYALPDEARVTLTVYDLLGQEVETLVDEVQSAGVKRVVWSGEGSAGTRRIASGLYFYRLSAVPSGRQAKASYQVKKMLFLK